MSSYLLLRNNKETGPFTLEQLVSGGLKPYDLVWLQGKSAAWRYPSEIAELQPYAPVVEEQPFDRFYKKTEEAGQPELPAVQQAVPEKTQAVTEVKAQPLQASPWEPKISQDLPQTRKSVFVTLPASAQKTVTPKPIPAPKPTPQPMEDEPVVAEIKYSQPLDDIKEMYVKTLHERRHRTAKKQVLVANAKKAAVVVGILLAGVLAGFALRSGDSGDKQPVIAASSAPAPVEQQFPEPDLEALPTGETTTVVIPMIDASRTQPTTRPVAQNNGLFKREESPREIRVTREALETAVRASSAQPAEVKPMPASIDPGTGERSRRTRNEDVSDPTPALPSKRVQRNAWEDLVNVTANDYKRVAFGGIRNLELTVTNNSKYPIENVVVQLEYIKPSEETLRTENIHFRSIGANEHSTIRIPDTNRGIRVNYRIIQVSSREMAESLANKN